jgi:hypothetical protein
VRDGLNRIRLGDRRRQRAAGGAVGEADRGRPEVAGRGKDRETLMIRTDAPKPKTYYDLLIRQPLCRCADADSGACAARRGKGERCRCACHERGETTDA